MKRSEMIEKLAEEIRGEYSWDGPKTRIGLEYAYYIAENVLDVVEKQGMLPPIPPMRGQKMFQELFNEELEWEPEDD